MSPGLRKASGVIPNRPASLNEQQSTVFAGALAVNPMLNPQKGNKVNTPDFLAEMSASQGELRRPPPPSVSNTSLRSHFPRFLRTPQNGVERPPPLKHEPILQTNNFLQNPSERKSARHCAQEAPTLAAGQVSPDAPRHFFFPLSLLVQTGCTASHYTPPALT